MHRVAKAQALGQLTLGDATFDQYLVKKRQAAMLKIDDLDALKAPPQAAQPDPLVVAQLQLKSREVGVKEGQLQLSAKKAQEDTQLKQRQLTLKTDSDAMKIAAQAAGGQKQADPNQRTLLALKNKQINKDWDKTLLDHQNKKLDRESKESVEALKIVNSLAVHPYSDGVVDQQLNQMSGLIKKQPGMADGGEVEGDGEGSEGGSGGGADKELYERALGDLAEALLAIVEKRNRRSDVEDAEVVDGSDDEPRPFAHGGEVLMPFGTPSKVPDPWVERRPYNSAFTLGEPVRSAAGWGSVPIPYVDQLYQSGLDRTRHLGSERPTWKLIPDEDPD